MQNFSMDFANGEMFDHSENILQFASDTRMWNASDEFWLDICHVQNPLRIYHSLTNSASCKINLKVESYMYILIEILIVAEFTQEEI